MYNTIYCYLEAILPTRCTILDYDIPSMEVRGIQLVLNRIQKGVHDNLAQILPGIDYMIACIYNLDMFSQLVCRASNRIILEHVCLVRSIRVM